MANLIKFTGKQCDGQLLLDVIVDDTLSAITSGDTLYITDIQTQTKKFCVVAGSIGRGGPQPTHTFVEYSDCSECLIDNNDYVIVESCYNREFIYVISVSDLPIGSNIGDSIYISLTPPRGDRDYTDCFTIKSFGVFNDEITVDNLSVVNSISSTTYTGCTECYQSNNLVYEVTECLNSGTYYVSLPGTLEGHIITFVYGIDQFCGVVGLVNPSEYNATFVADLGVFESDQQCLDCQDIVSDKRIITNCTTGDVEVAWASLFFDYGDASNLSIDGSCYLIGDLTESGVTITTDFLNYDVTPDCESCIQCNGIVYEYVTCDGTGPITLFTHTATTTTLIDGDYYSVTGTTDGSGEYALFYINVSSNSVSIVGIQSGGYGYNSGDSITLYGTNFGGTAEDIIEITITEVGSTGYIYSYYYYDGIINTTFYNPTLNNCCQIKGIGGGSPNQYYTSFNTYDGCAECENGYFVWVAEVCLTKQSIVVVTPVGFSPGEIVKLKYGTSDSACATLMEIYDPLLHYSINTIAKTDDVISYSDCETCDATITINLSVKECDSSINSYISLPLNIYYNYVYNLGLNTYSLYKYDKCYTILNICPLPGDYPTVTPYAFYLNCETCTFDNTRFPRSGGTETFLCLQICTPSGTTVTSVSVPHPVWTDGYGTAVTQLGMVVIGGPDGLNS